MDRPADGGRPGEADTARPPPDSGPPAPGADPDPRAYGGMARVFIGWWLVSASLLGGLAFVQIALSRGSSFTSWLLLVVVGLFTLSALMASAELARYGDASGGCVLGLVAGPFGWGLARARRRQLDARRVAEPFPRPARDPGPEPPEPPEPPPPQGA